MNENQVTKKSDNGVVISPRVDITENEKEVLLVADMPGVGQNGVDVDLERNVQTIKGTRTAEVMEGFELTNAEFQPVYSYERQFTLGDTIDRENISASMKDGVLRLVLPKVAEAAPRRIVVKSE
ncbi:MAG: Hsp20/alpha crystallin family protein [Victivallales bacterium]|nr:Hsp20/alpha crystallin family protein [Victivallales bacterium]